MSDNKKLSHQFHNNEAPATADPPIPDEVDDEFLNYNVFFATADAPSIQTTTTTTSDDSQIMMEQQLRDILAPPPSPSPILNALLASVNPSPTTPTFSLASSSSSSSAPHQRNVLLHPLSVSTTAAAASALASPRFRYSPVGSASSAASSPSTSSTAASTPTETKKQRKIRSHFVPSREELESCFDIPLSQAAKKFDISVSKMKKICRTHGIQRWPFVKQAKSGAGSKRKADDLLNQQQSTLEDLHDDFTSSDSDSSQHQPTTSAKRQRTMSPYPSSAVPATASATTTHSLTGGSTQSIETSSRVSTSPISAAIAQQLMGSVQLTQSSSSELLEALNSLPAIQALSQSIRSAIATVSSTTRQENKVVLEVHIVHHFRTSSQQEEAPQETTALSPKN